MNQYSYIRDFVLATLFVAVLIALKDMCVIIRRHRFLKRRNEREQEREHQCPCTKNADPKSTEGHVNFNALPAPSQQSSESWRQCFRVGNNEALDDSPTRYQPLQNYDKNRRGQSSHAPSNETEADNQ